VVASVQRRRHLEGVKVAYSISTDDSDGAIRQAETAIETIGNTPGGVDAFVSSTFIQEMDRRDRVCVCGGGGGGRVLVKN
jgi:hypothetical protein